MESSYKFRLKTERIGVLFGLILLMLTAFNGFTQNSEKAAKLYAKGLKAVDDLDVEKVYEYYAEAATTELDADSVDYEFVGNSIYFLAELANLQKNYQIATKFYIYASLNYGKGQYLDLSKKAMAEASRMEDSVFYKNLAINIDTTKNEETDLFYFSIYNIESVSDDTTWFWVRAGSNEGIEMGQQGGILTSHEKGTSRGNNVFGTATIYAVYNSISVAWVLPNEESKKTGLQLKEQDNLYLRSRVNPRVYKGQLYELAQLNIYFTDDYNDVISPYGILQQTFKEGYEREILKIYARIINLTALTLYEKDNCTDNLCDIIPEGPFAGLNVWEAMIQTTETDVKAFLRFVQSFPANYMGIRYRIDETYATWLLNTAQPSSEEVEILTAEYKVLDRAERKVWMDKNLRYVKSHGLDYPSFLPAYYGDLTEKNFDEAMVFAQEMLNLAKTVEVDTLIRDYKTLVSQVLLNQKKYLEGLKILETVVEKYPTYYLAHWYLGYAYLKEERYKNAQETYQLLMDSIPWAEGGFSSYAWTLILQGKHAQSFSYAEKAYQMDSTSSNAAAGLAHAYLLKNEPGNARRYYEKYLSLVDNATDFEEYLIEELDIFIENGWLVEEVKREKAYLIKVWEEHYQYKALAKYFFEKGKRKEETEERYLAAQLFDSAANAELQGNSVRYEWLRTYYTWAGYDYYYIEDYTSALKRYQQGWEVNRKYLNNAEYEADDLEAIADVSGWLSDLANEDMFRKMEFAAKRKQKSTTSSNTLYIISIGVKSSESEAYKYAESDAEDIAQTLLEKGRLIFDSSHVEVLVGERATSSNVTKALINVIGNSHPGDCFVMYYTGYVGRRNKKGMVFGEKDTFSNNNLLAYTRMMEASKILILMDAGNTGLVEQQLKSESEENYQSQSKNIAMIISDGRVELPDLNHGLFTHYLIEGLTSKAATQWGGQLNASSVDERESIAHISAKGLEGYMYSNLSKGNLLFDLSSYSTGVDFSLTYVNTDQVLLSTDSIPPMIVVAGAVSNQGMRGGRLKIVKSAIGELSGQVLDESGVKEIKINGKSISFTQNGKFSYSYVEGTQIVRVEATDLRGNYAVDSFEINALRTSNDVNVKHVRPKDLSRNYALLFATNEYDEWSDLANPLKDASAIKTILETKYGFVVELVVDPTAREMRTKLADYSKKLYSEFDQLFVFFAGHGIYVPNYGGQIVCKDSKLNDEGDNYSSYVPYSLIKSFMSSYDMKCRHVLLTMDVCFGGAGFDKTDVNPHYGSSLEDIKKDPNIFVKKTLAFESKLYLTSGGSEYVPDKSMFAERFIETLNTDGARKGGILTLDDFVAHMRNISTQPKYGNFGNTDPDGDFIFQYIAPVLDQNNHQQKSAGFTGGDTDFGKGATRD